MFKKSGKIRCRRSLRKSSCCSKCSREWMLVLCGASWFILRADTEVSTAPHRSFVFLSSRWEKRTSRQRIQLIGGVVQAGVVKHPNPLNDKAFEESWGQGTRRFTGLQILAWILSPNVIITAGKALMLPNHLIWTLLSPGWPTDALSSVTSSFTIGGRLQAVRFTERWLCRFSFTPLCHLYSCFLSNILSNLGIFNALTCICLR